MDFPDEGCIDQETSVGGCLCGGSRTVTMSEVAERPKVPTYSPTAGGSSVPKATQSKGTAIVPVNPETVEARWVDTRTDMIRSGVVGGG
jgi:hypothetical protein